MAEYGKRSRRGGGYDYAASPSPLTRTLSVVDNPSHALGQVMSLAGKAIEEMTRFFLVNVPNIVLHSVPELDRLCSIILSYLVMQVVGFVWAIFLGGVVALACKITSFLPYDDDSGGGEGDLTPQTTQNASQSQIQLVAAFYVSYASIRVFIGFAQNLYTLALESVSNFPTAAKVLSKGGTLTLSLAQLIFVPALVLQISLITADSVCLVKDDLSSTTSYLRHEFCRKSGLNFLTSESGETRRIVFLSLVVMMFQIWQILLQQFPKWSAAFHSMKPWKRTFSHVCVVLLSFLTIIGGLMALFRQDTPTTGVSNYYCVVLFGWTAWLCAFTPTLVAKYGERWSQRVTAQKLQGLAQVVRFSHLCVLGMLFLGITYFTGFLRAQLDLTILTIVVPTLFSGVYLISYMVIRAGRKLFFFIPFSLAVSMFVTMHLARTGGNGSVILVFFHILGKMVHFFSGDSPLDGDDDSIASYEIEESDEDADDDVVKSSVSSFSNQHKNHQQDGSRLAAFSPLEMRAETQTGASGTSPSLSKHVYGGCGSIGSFSETAGIGVTQEKEEKINSFSPTSLKLELKLEPQTKLADGSSLQRRYRSSPNLAGGHEKTILSAATLAAARSSDALKDLDTRGMVDSTFASLHLPQNIKEHWVVKMNRRLLHFLWQVARAVVIPDSILSGITRAFWAFAVLIGIILSFLSIGGFIQQRLKFFPNLADFHRLPNGALKFDHKIANVTLHTAASLASLRMAQRSDNNKRNSIKSLLDKDLSGKSGTCSNSSNANNIMKGKDVGAHAGAECNYDERDRGDLMENGLKLPYYSSCDLRWNGLSLLDFAILSEIAYFNDHDSCQHVSSSSTSSNKIGGKSALHTECKQAMIDSVLPGHGFVVQPFQSKSSGPNFFEVTSKKHDVTIISIRGTDPGRLHDFMEDIKLYAEPVIFTLLSSVFPTIRLWSHDTTSRVIEWLFEMNSFFGLQGEAEYYRPLAERIFQIIEGPDRNKRPIILTGHSLGGGLARIVGTLTKQKSITFSPPGLGLSYRKYSAQRPDGRVIRASNNLVNKGTMHHHSVAVVTEFDMITQVDRQVGLVQNILCDHEGKAHQNACHMLEGTICHLLEHCGDDKGRFAGCEYDFDIAAISPGVVSFLKMHSWFIAPFVGLIAMIFIIAIVPELM